MWRKTSSLASIRAARHAHDTAELAIDLLVGVRANENVSGVVTPL